MDSDAREKLVNYYVKGGVVEPHWIADGNCFWYAEGPPENTVIYKLDPKAKTKEPLFEMIQSPLKRYPHFTDNTSVEWDVLIILVKMKQSLKR